MILALVAAVFLGVRPAHELGPFGMALESPEGDVEPEYVAIDPKSRFAVVSCQENDAALVIDLRSGTPHAAGTLWTPFGGQPDGVAILDWSPEEGADRVLVALAEEGVYDPWKQAFSGNAVSFWSIDLDRLDSPRLLSRIDVRPLVQPGRPAARRDPESVLLRRLGGRVYALVTIERGDRVLCLDVTDPRMPNLVDSAKTGDRPEGIITVPRDEKSLYVITGDEGDDGPGEITVLVLEAE